MMKLGKLFLLVMLSIHIVYNPLLIAVVFRDQKSKLKLSNGSLYFQYNPRVITGTVDFDPTSTLAFWGKPLIFINGIYSENGSELIFTGLYDTLQERPLRLGGPASAKSLFDANIGARMLIYGSDNVIEGRPKFLTPDALALYDANTLLYLGVSGNFTSNILMNYGSIILKNDLQLGEGIVFKGPGNVALGGNNIFFGATQTIWDTAINWIDANNINLGGDARMSGNWTFSGNGSIIGNNHTLDISGTGLIYIRANSNIEFNNLVVKGIGSGSIIFEDDSTSSITFKNCTLSLDRNYTVESGKWIIARPSTVITGNNVLNFATSGQLSVSPGSSLTYDTLDANDNKNIVLLDGSPVSNCGTIVFAKKLPIGSYRLTSDVRLDRDVRVTVLRNLEIVNPVTINGAQFTYSFARNPTAPIFILDNNAQVTFTNITLKNFPVANSSVSYGANSNIILGNLTTVELGDSATLTTTWHCVGQTYVYGNGKVLTLGTDGNIILSPGASILFDNITLKNIHGYNIKCMDDRCTVSFGTVLWQQDNDYNFINGKLYVRDTLELLGSSTFNYATAQISTIASLGDMTVGHGMTFKYNPPTENKDLLAFEDSQALLQLNSGCLSVTTTGMRLTKGTLQVSGIGVLQNYGALSQSQAVVFGDGNPANDLTIKLDPSAVLDVQSGILLFNQA